MPRSPLTLDRVALGRVARVSRVDWDALPAQEARRLKDFGLYEGAEVEPLHRGALFFRDPLAVRLGRLSIILRGKHARAVTVVPEPD